MFSWLFPAATCPCNDWQRGAACLGNWKNIQSRRRRRVPEAQVVPVPAEQLERVQHEENGGSGLIHVLIKM